MTAPAPPDAGFPCRVRFKQGRIRHRTRQPDGQRWWEALEAVNVQTEREQAA